MKKAQVERLADEIQLEMKKWYDELNNGLVDLIKSSSTQFVKKIKEKTPTFENNATKRYINCYQNRKTNDSLVRVIWNRKYQLAHLLENGHEVFNRKGKKRNLASRVGGPYRVKHSRKYPESNGKMKTKDFGMWTTTADEIEIYMLNKLKKLGGK